MRHTRTRSFVATVATCAAVAVAIPPSVAAPSPDARLAGALPAGTTVTPFAFNAGAYGTLVQGGQVAANSGRTAFSYIGCTKLAGRSRANHLVRGDLGDEGFVEGVGTRSWTTRSATGVVSSYARTDVERARIGTLVLRGIALKTRAWHDRNGFHADRTASIAGLRLDGSPVDLPTRPGQVVDLPGVGELVFLTGRKRVTQDGAWVSSKAVQIRLDETTDSVITLGSAFSAINNENPAGIMSGYGQAATVRTLDGRLTSGRVAVQPLACPGTDGVWVNNDTAAVDLQGGLALGAASGGARGEQRNRLNGYAQTRGTVSSLHLGGTQVVARGIKGQANVSLVDGQLRRSIRGTTLGYLAIGGREVTNVRPGDSFPVQGVGRVTFAKRLDAGPRGVHVIALQVRLFNGAAADTLVNLGEATTRYKRY